MENINDQSNLNKSETSNTDWQNEENENRQFVGNEDVDLKSAEASGYGSEDESMFASSVDPNDKDDADDDEPNDDSIDGVRDTDWGTVDPLEGGPPSDMDPSGPGSAV